MIVIKLNVKKIDKELLIPGEKGLYLDCALFDKPNEYGDDGYVRQGMTKEKRDEGCQGPIIGNWRNKETAKPKAPPKPVQPPLDEDEIPW